MQPVRTSRLIASTPENVFQTISNPIQFCSAITHILNVEILSHQSSGLGTRFRETREMNGRKSTVELEITEYKENSEVRFVSDAGGTVWDTLFTLSVSGDHVLLEMHMEVRPYKLAARLMNLLIARMVVRGVEDDMDAIKAFCERSEYTEE